MSNYGIFDRLGFPDSLAANTVNYSNTTINTLQSVPNLLTDWQMQDIANSNTSGYFVNPALNSSNTLISDISYIDTISVGVTGLETILAAANNVVTSNNLIKFRDHTNRLSGVSPPDFENPNLPHYDSAIGTGKVLTYLVFQSDGITNNAVFIGNFGSIIKTQTLSDYANTINSDVIVITNSINGGSSNLSAGQKTTIINHINSMNTFVLNTRTDDENFFANCNSVIEEFKQLKGFNGMGQTQTDIINNYIGSPKLLSRLNS
jgi:hypothetical protein